MKSKYLLSMGLITAGVLLNSVSAVAQTASIVLDQADNAYVTIKRDIVPGTFVPGSGFDTVVSEVTANAPSLLEVVGEPVCDGPTVSAGQCNVILRLHKDGPVTLNAYDSSGFLPYGPGLTSTAEDTLSIDLDLWGFNKFFVGWGLKQPAFVANNPNAKFLESSGGIQLRNVNVNERDSYIEIEARISNNPEFKTTYQNLHLVASATSDEYVLFGENSNRDYISVDGDKGTPAGAIVNNSFYNFTVDRWNQTGGNYAALRFLTNGSDAGDTGLDLTEFNSVTANLNCAAGSTYEVFVGSGAVDSSQTFLGEIHCDGVGREYTFNLPQATDLTDIQTGLWFHLPVWKNTSVDYSIYMNVFGITFNK